MKTVTRYIIIGWSFITIVGLCCSSIMGINATALSNNGNPTGYESIGVMLGLLILLIFWGLVWCVISIPSLVVNVVSK